MCDRICSKVDKLAENLPDASETRLLREIKEDVTALKLLNVHVLPDDMDHIEFRNTSTQTESSPVVDPPCESKPVVKQEEDTKPLMESEYELLTPLLGPLSKRISKPSSAACVNGNEISQVRKSHPKGIKKCAQTVTTKRLTEEPIFEIPPKRKKGHKANLTTSSVKVEIGSSAKPKTIKKSQSTKKAGGETITYRWPDADQFKFVPPPESAKPDVMSCHTRQLSHEEFICRDVHEDSLLCSDCLPWLHYNCISEKAFDKVFGTDACFYCKRQRSLGPLVEVQQEAYDASTVVVNETCDQEEGEPKGTRSEWKYYWNLIHNNGRNIKVGDSVYIADAIYGPRLCFIDLLIRDTEDQPFAVIQFYDHPENIRRHRNRRFYHNEVFPQKPDRDEEKTVALSEIIGPPACVLSLANYKTHRPRCVLEKDVYMEYQGYDANKMNTFKLNYAYSQFKMEVEDNGLPNNSAAFKKFVSPPDFRFYLDCDAIDYLKFPERVRDYQTNN